MENVLSKKVRRFLAFTLAFILAVPSLPAATVRAEDDVDTLAGEVTITKDAAFENQFAEGE